jgi:hypothetical protein
VQRLDMPRDLANAMRAAAEKEGIAVEAWIVRALRAALPIAMPPFCGACANEKKLGKVPANCHEPHCTKRKKAKKR